LEAKLTEQRQTIARQEDRIHHLETERERIDDDIDRHVRNLMDRMDKEVDNMKDDLEHKFALQIAENKRLQNQLMKQKADAEQISGYCKCLETRIRKLQDEIGRSPAKLSLCRLLRCPILVFMPTHFFPFQVNSSLVALQWTKSTMVVGHRHIWMTVNATKRLYMNECIGCIAVFGFWNCCIVGSITHEVVSIIRNRHAPLC